MVELAIIAIDINKLNKNFDNYEALSAADKIELIASTIKKTCENLKEIEPHALWLITWREYGAVSRNKNSHKSITG